MLFKVDVASSFCNLRVDPANALKCGIKWANVFYVDLAIVFGWTHGSGIFQILSNTITFIMAKKGLNLHCYIDDYITVTSKDKASQEFTSLCDLLNELGLPINESKLTPPTKSLTCLGIDINIDDNTMSISQEKLEAIYAERMMVSNKNSPSKHSFQSLLGKLIYIQRCVKPSRTFINKILELFRKNSHLQKSNLTLDFHKDIQWFLAFLPTYNGVSYINKTQIDETHSLRLKACLTDMGAVWQNRVYATP